MTVEERFAAHAHAWGVQVDEVRTTETSRLGFGTREHQRVVLKVTRREASEEWRSGEVLDAFAGGGTILPIAHAPGAVLLPRLVPAHDLVSLCAAGRDDEAADIIASLIRRMPTSVVPPAGIGSVDRLGPDFVQFRDACDGFIPKDYVDRAEALFVELCATERAPRLLHGDLHHYNVLFDSGSGWVAIDPWGAVGELEFELGPSLRNPISPLVESPRTLERRLRIYERCLEFDSDRALKWAFATTVLGVLWPFEEGVGPDLRLPFARAARSMYELLGLR